MSKKLETQKASEVIAANEAETAENYSKFEITDRNLHSLDKKFSALSEMRLPHIAELAYLLLKDFEESRRQKSSFDAELYEAALAKPQELYSDNMSDIYSGIYEERAYDGGLDKPYDIYSESSYGKGSATHDIYSKRSHIRGSNKPYGRYSDRSYDRDSGDLYDRYSERSYGRDTDVPYDIYSERPYDKHLDELYADELYSLRQGELLYDSYSDLPYEWSYGSDGDEQKNTAKNKRHDISFVKSDLFREKYLDAISHMVTEAESSPATAELTELYEAQKSAKRLSEYDRMYLCKYIGAKDRLFSTEKNKKKGDSNTVEAAVKSLFQSTSELSREAAEVVSYIKSPYADSAFDKFSHALENNVRSDSGSPFANAGKALFDESSSLLGTRAASFDENSSLLEARQAPFDESSHMNTIQHLHEREKRSLSSAENALNGMGGGNMSGNIDSNMGGIGDNTSDNINDNTGGNMSGNVSANIGGNVNGNTDSNTSGNMGGGNIGGSIDSNNIRDNTGSFKAGKKIRLRAVYGASFKDACEDVYYGRSEFCILPISNTSEGKLSGFGKLIAKYELKIVLSCNINTQDSGYTKFVLLKKNIEYTEIKGKSVGLDFVIPQSDGERLPFLLNAAEFFGMTDIGISSTPAEYLNHGFSHDICCTAKADSDICGFLCFLALEFPSYEQTGIYPNV